MDKLPIQNELIVLLRAAAAAKNLNADKLLAMLPNDEKKISKSTIQRLLGSEDPAALNCEYNTLFVLGEILIDSTNVQGRTALLHFKKSVVQTLELENSLLRERLDSDKNLYTSMAEYRSAQTSQKDSQIDKLFDTIANKEAQIEKLLQMLDKKEDQISSLLNQLLTKCDNCKLRM